MSREAKAERLLAAGNVEPLNSDGLTQLVVIGDSGSPYRVVVGPTLSGMCQCEYWRRTMLPCSHIAAAIRLRTEQRAEKVEAWMLATAARKAADAARGEALIEALQE